MIFQLTDDSSGDFTSRALFTGEPTMPLTEGITSFFAGAGLEVALLVDFCLTFFFTGVNPGMAGHACVARWFCNKCLSAHC